MSKPKYPKYMPVLKAGDLIRGKYDKGNCRCLSGWIHEAVSGNIYFALRVVDPGRQTASARLHRAVVRECVAMGLVREPFSDKAPLPNFNDCLANSLADLAKAFNRAMRKKGYVWEMDR